MKQKCNLIEVKTVESAWLLFVLLAGLFDWGLLEETLACLMQIICVFERAVMYLHTIHALGTPP